MSANLESLEPVPGADRSVRRRLALRHELVLALLPTVVVLLVLLFVEMLSEQRLLFASLASSAFLIYLDPEHGTNRVRTLVLSQALAATIGFAAHYALGAGYASGGTAMVATIFLMIVLDAVHPPAVATSLAFAFRAGDEGNLLIFAMALGITATLVALERTAVWMMARMQRRR
jgi:CBS-domain-containing membrane protein